MFLNLKVLRRLSFGNLRRTLFEKQCMPGNLFHGYCNFSTFGFIGLGAMGSHMAKNLLRQDKVVTVFDLNESSVLKLQKSGAQVAKHLDELSNTDCIISMLPNDKSVLEVYQPPNGLISKMKPGSLLIDCSTVDPETPQKLAIEAKQRSLIFLDAPVSGGVLAAASGQLTFMVGGSEEGARQSEAILKCMGKRVIYCGTSGNGQVSKICNNLILAISMIATAEAMNLGIRLGMDPKLLASVINSSTGRCWASDTYNPVPDVISGVPASNNYEGGFMSKLMLKDLTIANTVAQRSETPMLFGKSAQDIYKSICETGKSDKDFSVVFKFINEMKKMNNN